MRIARKFSLDRVGLKYESLVIEVEGDSYVEIIQRIEEVYQYYIEQIQKKAVT